MCRRRWHKTNADASNLVSRVLLTAGVAGPKHLSTNVVVPSLVAGKSSLHLLPDRVLLRDGKVYSDVSYAHLRSRGHPQRFIESPGALPRDSQQVGQTWQYVNVKGGPDRRYANNPVLPIMLLRRPRPDQCTGPELVRADVAGRGGRRDRRYPRACAALRGHRVGESPSVATWRAQGHRSKARPRPREVPVGPGASKRVRLSEEREPGLAKKRLMSIRLHTCDCRLAAPSKGVESWEPRDVLLIVRARRQDPCEARLDLHWVGAEDHCELDSDTAAEFAKREAERTRL